MLNFLSDSLVVVELAGGNPLKLALCPSGMTVSFLKRLFAFWHSSGFPSLFHTFPGPAVELAMSPRNPSSF